MLPFFTYRLSRSKLPLSKSCRRRWFCLLLQSRNQGRSLNRTRCAVVAVATCRRPLEHLDGPSLLPECDQLFAPEVFLKSGHLKHFSFIYFCLIALENVVRYYYKPFFYAACPEFRTTKKSPFYSARCATD